MIKYAPGFLLCFFAAGLAFGADPSPTPAPIPFAIDSIAQLDMRTTTVQEFVAKNPGIGFRWLSAAHDSAENIRPGLTLFQIPVSQIVVRFADSKISEIAISFYNRGDSGDMPRDQFELLNQTCAKALTDFTKIQPVERGKDPTNAVKATGLSWQTDKAQFLLESSFSRLPDAGYRAEFVRLTITAPEKPKTLLEQSLAADLPAARFSGTDHVKTLPNGDVLIQGIPMVDQGEKGYCVVASAERVLRYYGVKVDENELAEVANTDAQQGTSPAAMINSLKKLANRLRVKTRVLEEFDGPRFTKMFDDYDHIAKRGNRAPTLDMGVKNLSELFQQMDPAILTEARTKNPSEMDRFFRTVQAHVDQGIPPLWSVMIGIIPHGKTPEQISAASAADHRL